MIEVDHVILHHLRACDQIADDPGVLGNVNAEGIFNRTDAGERMHHGADTADTLRPDPGLPGIAALQDNLHAAEHGPGTPRVGDFSAVELRLYPQVAFDASHRIYYQARHLTPPFWFQRKYLPAVWGRA